MNELAPLTLLALACISGCSAPDATEAPEITVRTATPSSNTIEQSLNNYAQTVVAATDGNISDPTPAEKTLDSPLSYVMKFHTSDPALMAKNDGDTNKLSYAFNVALQEGWSRRFCTPHLRSLMATHGVFLVSGHLLNANDELQVFSSCM